MESKPFSLIILVATLFALYADDIWLCGLTRHEDLFLQVITTVVMFLFFIELVLMSSVNRKYIFSFFWWLDLLAALSLAFDIPWLSSPLIHLFGMASGNDDTAGEVSLARAGRAARVGTRVGRLLKMLRIIRMVRIFKLFHLLNKKKLSFVNKHVEDTSKTTPTIAGQKVVTLIAMKVILGVMALVLLLPLLQPSEVDTSHEEGLKLLQLPMIQANLQATESAVALFLSMHEASLLYLRVNSSTYTLQQERLCALRPVEEMKWVNTNQELCDMCTDHNICPSAADVAFDGVDPESCAVFDISPAVQYDALMMILQTTLVIIMLALQSGLLTQDVNKWLIGPIQRMMHILKPSVDMQAALTHVSAGGNSMLAEAMIRQIHASNLRISQENKDLKEANKALTLAVADYSQPEMDLIKKVLGDDPRLVHWKVDPQELKLIKRVGKGSFGDVYQAEYRSMITVVKTVRPTTISEDTIREMKAEIVLMSELRHPNIVQFLGASLSCPNIFLMLEWMQNGSLHDVLKRHSKEMNLTWHDPKLRMAIDTARGIAFLHAWTPPIAHRDLKSHNLLVSTTFTVKVGDFGLSRRINSEESGAMTLAGSPHWIAPEVIKGEPYDESMDVYSFGCVLQELVTHRMPYDGVALDAYGITKAVAEEGLRPAIPATCPSGLKSLMMDCWSTKRHDRPSMQKVLATLVGLADELSQH